MSDADLMLYPDDNGNNHYETPNLECVLQGYTEVGEVPVDSTVIYYWQYPTPAFQSSETSNVDQTFLDTKLFNTIANFERLASSKATNAMSINSPILFFKVGKFGPS